MVAEADKIEDDPIAEVNGDEWIPDQPPVGEGPNPDVEHPEPTPVETPKSYGLADIDVKIQDGTTKTLEEWQSDPLEAITVSCTDHEDEDVVFDFDDPTSHPRDVVVYTAGRS